VEQVDGKNIDGSLTLAENIADNGGIKISYEAFLQLMQSKGTPANDAGSRFSCAPASCLVAAALAVMLSVSCSECALTSSPGHPLPPCSRCFVGHALSTCLAGAALMRLVHTSLALP
jgi:hypothetical protein